MKYIYSIILLALITSCNMPVENQTNNNGEPEGSHTSAEWQIWAYSTAAPDYIAADATVFDGPPDMGGNLLREGTNGWTCLPANPRGQSDPENGWVDAHEAMPLCGDGEVFKWIGAYFAGEVPVMDKDGYAWIANHDHTVAESLRCGEMITCPLPFSINKLSLLDFSLINSYKFESKNMGIGTVGLPHNGSLWIGSYKSDRLAEANLSISE